MYAHVALMGFTWGLMWVTDRRKRAWSKRFLMFSVSQKQSKFSTVLAQRLEHNRDACHVEMQKIQRHHQICFYDSEFRTRTARGSEIINWKWKNITTTFFGNFHTALWFNDYMIFCDKNVCKLVIAAVQIPKQFSFYLLLWICFHKTLISFKNRKLSCQMLTFL